MGLIAYAGLVFGTVGFPGSQYPCNDAAFRLQDESTFLVVAFAPDADPSDVPPVYGNVTSLGDGQYGVSYSPTYADT